MAERCFHKAKVAGSIPAPGTIIIMRTAIIGFGDEGKTLLAFLRKSPAFKKAGVTVLDRDPAVSRVARRMGIAARTGASYLSGLAQFDIVFR